MVNDNLQILMYLYIFYGKIIMRFVNRYFKQSIKSRVMLIMQKTEEKIFLVFNTACLGDVLLCNSLIQNIKNIYPESKVVFIADKPFKDVALYQQGVDEVVVFDKSGENKSLFGLIGFIKNFKYKKPYASIITYYNERNFIVAKLIGSNKTVMCSNRRKTVESIQERNNHLLSKLTEKEIKNYPIKYNIPQKIIEKIDPSEEKYIALCFTSKKDEKDVPLNVGTELVKKFNNEDLKVVFTGAGDKAKNYAEKLENNGCRLINFVNKTTIPELAAVIRKSSVLLSVDTGTLHLGNAVGTKCVAVWYEDETKSIWMPNKDLYDIKVIDTNQTADNIFKAVIESLKSEEIHVQG